MTNIITLPFRLTQPLPQFGPQLLHHLSNTFESIHPDLIKIEINGITKLRDESLIEHCFIKDDNYTGSGIGNGNKSRISEMDRIYAYYAQLTYALTKLPLDIDLPIPYYPLFSTPPSSSSSSIASTISLSLGSFPTSSQPILISNLQYERLSVLYNISALWSLEGWNCSRKDEKGIKASITAFQNAAGVLNHLLTLLPLLKSIPPALNPVAPDLTTSSIESLRNLCLAQAQEGFWQKAMMDNLKNGTISKLAAKVSEYYGDALTSAIESKGAGGVWPLFGFPPEIVNYLTIKKLHFAAVAQYRKSVDDQSANRYGDEIGRLSIAQELVQKALEVPKKGVVPAVYDDLASMRSHVATLLKTAIKNNDMIYLEAITSPSALPFLTPATMVKASTPPQILSPISYLHNGPGGLGKPYFEELVPWEVHQAVKVYEDRKDNLGKDSFTGRKRELDSKATRTLRSLNLPASLEAVQQPTTLPPSLLYKAEDVRASRGVTKLNTMMQDVRKVSQVNQRLLDEGMSILRSEETEDNALRAQYGTDRWIRQPSRIAHSQLIARVEHFGTILQDAIQSDGVVRAKYGEWAELIDLLGGDEQILIESIPTMTATIPSNTTPMRDLRRTLDELEDLQSLRTHTVNSALRALTQDDLRPKIMDRATLAMNENGGMEKIEMSIFEEIFEEGLSKFGKFRLALSDSESRQEDLLVRIKSANEVFIRSRLEDPRLKAREEALQNLDIAYTKYQEITINLQEGLKFYSDLSKILSDLREAIKQWAYSRTVEARDQITSLTALALEKSHISVKSPGTYDFSKDGPLRFG